ncbi:MAG: MATE family efflux transporter [Eubacterium sp.]|nr:MATE family efflux transporter [Eubacterium sp.]
MRTGKTENSIYKKALVLAVPMMIQNGITNAVGLVDNLMVGSLGTESMTAVSIVGQLIFVFFLAIFGGLSGPGIYSAQYFGKGDIQGVRRIFRLKIWIALICTICGTIIFMCFGSELIGLYLHGESADIDSTKTLKLGMDYLGIMLIGFLPFCITQVYASSLRETGESIKPMIAGICSVATDIILNYLFIYGKFGAPRLEVKGAAVATVISRVVEMSVIIISSHANKQKHQFLQGIYKTLKVPVNIWWPVVRKGFPIFINEFSWAGGIAVLTQCYSLRGLDVIAGMNISNAICNLLNVVFIALGNAVGIIIGQYLGASRYEEAEKSGTKLMWFTGAVCVILTVILISLSGVFPKAYDTTQQVRDYGTKFIVITALFFPLQGFLNSLYFTLRSGGKTLITLLFDSGYTWAFAVTTALILCHFTDMHILNIYLIIQMMDFIKVTIGYILIKKKIWLNNLV